MQNTASRRLNRITSHLTSQTIGNRIASTSAKRSIEEKPSIDQVPSKSSAHKLASESKNIIWDCSQTYRYWIPIQTRWSDNDQYGHMNNAYYYHLFDTVANRFLIEKCTPANSSAPMAFVVSSDCTYLRPVGFPTPLLIGLATEHIGRSSVRWRFGLWPARLDSSNQGEAGCAAFGSFTHVFVDPQSHASVEMNPAVRSGASSLLISSMEGTSIQKNPKDKKKET
ncbi:hypothetical protein CROQUDRAFT_62655 [Cronartium quercuum f. sp. fusiforme G11]|uniref:Thioesterase domain-containing protein n=1 Tax=Cronartium quercuum f. sp. fusiforme G11 TaxID=708437 RepID=A0A9P6NND9_9BASI|nr:hypothetical protein CROQUDRAFT_62655 [Cronartium quercuum f. sp. fusiforme G11]